MKTRKNSIFSLSFVAVIVAMIVFNSCDKYENTYSVDDSKCAACLECISVCGQHAISLVTSGTTKYVTIDQDKCIGCGKCYNTCSYHAISGD